MDESLLQTEAEADGPVDEVRSLSSIAAVTIECEPGTVNLTEEEQRFIRDGCKCKANCLQYFEKVDVLSSHWDCVLLRHTCNANVNHLNLAVKGALNAVMRTGERTMRKEHAPKEREKTYTYYMFRGQQVCREFFQFVYGCGEKKLKNEKTRLATLGMAERPHGSVKNVCAVSDAAVRDNAITFIRTFAQQHALVLPGRLPTYRLNTDLHLLPCSMNKAYVYREYVATCVGLENTFVSRSSWYALWQTCCANIVVQKPRTDLCAVCQSQITTLSRLQGLTESEKEARIKAMTEHLSRVRGERLFYNDLIAECRNTLMGQPMCSLRPRIPNSNPFKVHISFDFAQQIGIPSSSQQVGPVYFLSQYKVGLFGIGIEPLKKFVLYLIPESCMTGKGANVVISLLHHFFSTFGLGEMELECHADNCAAQNKNNYLMRYFAWRIQRKLHTRIGVHFLPVGHTKFFPDIFFGLFKRALKKFDCFTLKDVVRAAAHACSDDTIIPVLVGNASGRIYVPTYEWVKHFEKQPVIPGILGKNHFEITKNGIACSTDRDDGKTQCSVFANDFNFNTLPQLVKPTGLSIARRKYLSEKLSPYVPQAKRSYYLWRKLSLRHSSPAPEPSTSGTSMGAKKKQPGTVAQASQAMRTTRSRSRTMLNAEY